MWFGFAWAEFKTDETSANQQESFAVLISKGSLGLTNNFLTIKYTDLNTAFTRTTKKANKLER